MKTDPAPSLAQLMSDALLAMKVEGLPFETLEANAGWQRDRKRDSFWYICDSGTGRTGRPWLQVSAGDARVTGGVDEATFTWCSWTQDQGGVDEAEQEEIRRQLEQAAKRRKEQQAKDRQTAAEQATGTWAAASADCDRHPYLQSKGVQAWGIKRLNNTLLIPVADIQGKLHGLQTIGRDGGKRFNQGAAVVGHFHLIGTPGRLLYVAEGYATAATIHEATGEAVAVAFNAGNLLPVAKALRAAHPDLELVIAADNDQWTDGNPGLTKAREAAATIGTGILFPAFQDVATHPTDFNDLARLEGLEEVRRQLLTEDQDKDEQPKETPQQAIKRLAAMPALDYELVRETEAKDLGFRVSVLDREVEKARGGGEEGETRGREIKLYEPAPWDHPVEGAAVLNAAMEAVLRHMVMRPEDAAAVVLWAAHSFIYDRFSHTPRLLITAPDAECGKTLLMTHMVGNLVNKPQSVELMKAAPFFRLAESHRPTFLIDEMDVFIKEDSDLLAAVNNGFEPHGGVPRCVGDNFDVRFFSTHTPVAMAGIRLIEKLPATTIGRSVVINLDRATDTELADDNAYDSRKHRRHLLELGRKLCRWTRDNAERLHRADPQLPPRVRNRLADKWRPLFAIAEAAGGHWPEKVRAALFSQSAEKEPSKAVQLLIDMKEIMAGRTAISTADLLNRLATIEDSVWAAYNFRAHDTDARRLTDRQLAGLLKPYGVFPDSVRIGDKTPKGYKAEDLKRVWTRYLPGDPPAHPQHRNKSTTARAGGQVDPQHEGGHVADTGGGKPNGINGCCAVAANEGVSGKQDTQRTYRETF